MFANPVREVAVPMVKETAAAAAHLARILCNKQAGSPVLTPAGHDRPRTPVLLVHGLLANKSYWAPLTRILLAAGHPVYPVDYRWAGPTVADCGTEVARCGETLARITGAGRIHLVGHSLGGVVSKWACANTSLGDQVGTAVSLGSPHRGTPLAVPAHLLPVLGPLLSELRPGHQSLRSQESPLAGHTRWHTIGAKADLVVPHAFSRLPDQALRHGELDRHEVFGGVGHLGLLLDRAVLRRVADHLA